MMVRCKECNKEFEQITWAHLYHKHNMSMEDYRKRHPNARLVPDEVSNKISEVLEGRYLAQEGGEKDLQDVSTVTCEICGKKLREITNTHLRIHDMTVDEYKKEFPDAETVSRGTRKKLKEKNSGENCYWYGKKRSAEARAKMSESHKGKTLNASHRKKIGEAQKGKTYSKEVRRKISGAIKEYYENNPERCNEISERMKGENNPAKQPEVRKKMLSIRRPTSIERRIINIRDEFDLPYEYVGNGEFWIKNMNPDFVNTNDKKVVIEVLGDHWHTPEEFEERKERMAEYGWSCIGIWGHELENCSDREILQLFRRRLHA